MKNEEKGLLAALERLQFQADFQRGYGSDDVQISRRDADLILAAYNTRPVAPASAVEALRALAWDIANQFGLNERQVERLVGMLTAALTAKAHPAGDDGVCANCKGLLGDLSHGRDPEELCDTCYEHSLAALATHPRPDEEQGQSGEGMSMFEKGVVATYLAAALLFTVSMYRSIPAVNIYGAAYYGILWPVWPVSIIVGRDLVPVPTWAFTFQKGQSHD